MSIQGHRVDIEAGHHVLEAGQYGKCPREGVWYARPPVPEWLTANLAKHQIVEHKDGTITARPSILVSDGRGGHSWHGYLTRGVWSLA